MDSLKGQVIRLFLKFVSNYVPLKQAQLATLGGKGVEATIWNELGIPSQNGWLIERNRKRGRNLIDTHRYRTQNQLGTFPQILAGHGGRGIIDAFHLDLCGTLSNKAISAFEPALPLVLRSDGRCLAITVADSRRNLVLENWPNFRSRGKKLFGVKSTEIFAEIQAKQREIPVNTKNPAFIRPFDPEKAAKREFGLLVELTELLQVSGFKWVPVVMQRFVYVSRYQNRPFRMRTYFFHFEQKKMANPEIVFAKAWVGSSLLFANREEFAVVKTAGMLPIVQKTETRREVLMESVPVKSRLEAVAKALGGAEEAEYHYLLSSLDRLQIIIGALRHTSIPLPTLPPVAKVAEVVEAPVVAKSVRKPRKKYDDLSDQEKIEWQIKALELRQKSNGSWHRESWKALLKEDFGYYNEALGRSLRSSLARTSGGFRKMFAARVKEVFGAEAKPYLDRLEQIQ